MFSRKENFAAYWFLEKTQNSIPVTIRIFGQPKIEFVKFIFFKPINKIISKCFFHFKFILTLP